MAAGKLEQVLTGVQSAGQIVSLGVPAVGGIISLVSGTILAIRKLRENSDGTVDYEMVLTLGKAELDNAESNADATIDSVNAELSRMGKPTIQK